jgi:menaquinone-dependent protoporphyrinogen oxidase
MRVLIVFGTTEGHTRGLAEFMAARLAAGGHEVAVRGAAREDGPPDPAGFDAAIVAASLHAGRYQREVARFARAHRAALDGMPSAFVSVSLSAAGRDPEDRAGLAACVARFERDTLWTPRAVHHAGGAIRFSRYGLLKRWALRLIARRRGYEADPAKDHDLTDYGALARFVDGFVSDLGKPSRRAVPGGRPASKMA